MILTCPECATRYFVADDRLGPQGRTVKCASCGAAWKASPSEDVLELSLEPEAAAPAKPRKSGEPAAAVPTAALPGEALPRVYRERERAKKRAVKAAAAGAVWAAVGAGALILLATAVVFRVDVVRLWPKTASAYAAVGMPVNPTGLAIEDVEALPSLEDGRAAVVVTGAIRNVTERETWAPPVRISLVDDKGRPVQVKIATADDARVPPGEARYFSVSLVDPPAGASNVSVAFVLEGARKPPEAEAHEAERGPAPKKKAADHAAPAAETHAAAAVEEAAPLPADSPYAAQAAPQDAAHTAH